MDDEALLQKITLCEVLDRVLNKGVVLAGEATISVANVELLYLDLRLLVCSSATKHRVKHDDQSDAHSNRNARSVPPSAAAPRVE